MSPGPSASDVSLAPEPSSASLSSSAPALGVDEMGVLTMSPVGGMQLQLQLNDVPVGIIHVPDPTDPADPVESDTDSAAAAAYPALRDKGKGRAGEYDSYGGAMQFPLPPPLRTDDTASSIASVGSIGSLVSERSTFTVPWARGGSGGGSGSLPASPSGSERSSYFGSAVELPRISHERAATAPAAGAGSGAGAEKEKEKEKGALLKKRSTIGRMWKQVVRSVTVRRSG